MPLRRAYAATRLLQSRLDRVAVDAAILEIEFVRPLVDDVHRGARHEPERDRLAAAAVLLARPCFRELRVGCDDGAGMLERLAAPVLAKDLPLVHARTVSRTHFSWSRKRRRSSSRSLVLGPWPVTTERSSSQSGSVYSQTPSSPFRSFGSGTSRPSSRICGT